MLGLKIYWIIWVIFFCLENSIRLGGQVAFLLKDGVMERLGDGGDGETG